MQRSNSMEADKLLLRLERKFHRRAIAQAQRKQTRYIRSAFSGLESTDWDITYEDIVPQR